jgi:putative transcriptional regulator
VGYDRAPVPAPSPTSLEAPALLVAMPQVMDPFFHRSVVLLMHQDDEEGSFGLIVNRRTAMKVGEILSGLEIPWNGSQDAGAFFGGPVQPQLGSVLFAQGSEGVSEGALERLSAATEVAPGLAVTHHVGDLRVLAEAPPDRMRLFLGYAGWGAGQLVEEILRDDWLLAPVQEDLVFAPDPDEVWEKAVRSVGVDPATLPSWSAGGGDQEAN